MATDVLTYLNQKGLFPKQATQDNWNMLCPFCNEPDGKRGRLYVNVDPNADIPGLFQCKRCDAHGSLVSLQKHFGDATDKQEKEDTGYLRRAIFGMAAEYYVQALDDHLPALRWLVEERGLTIEMINKHKLGYASGGVFKHLRANGFEIMDIIATGLTTTQRDTGKTIDFLNDHITIPYMVAESVVMIRGRALGEVDDGRKYVTGPGQKARLFNTDMTWGVDEVIACEGEFDSMVLEQLGYNSVAVPGANTWQDAWDGYFTEARRVWIIFDRDEREVGDKGAQKVLQHLGSRGRKVDLPPHDLGKSKNDITEFIVKCGHTKEDLDALLRLSRGALLTVQDAVKQHSELQGQSGLKFGISKLDLLLNPGLLSSQLMVILAKTGCLAGDTELSLNRAGRGFRMDIKTVVERMNDGLYAWDQTIPTYVQREQDDVVRLALVKAAWCSGVKQTYTVTTAGGRSIRATDEHPFMTDRGWLRLDELVVGDQLHVRGMNKVDLDLVVSITSYGMENTYDIEVDDDPHNFIANEIVVHNSGKTILMLNLFYRICKAQPDAKILFLSLEQTRGDWWERARRIYRFFNDDATDQDAFDFWKDRIWMDDRNRVGPEAFDALIDDFKYEVGQTPTVIGVDYLGYWARSFKGDSSYERTSGAVMTLKEAAKNHQVPIIAPHQVSRMTTHGSEPSIDNARDSVTGDTRVMLADGRNVPIRDLVGTTPEVVTVDKDYSLTVKQTLEVWKKPDEREVFRLTTESGRSVTGTAEHPVFTAERDFVYIANLKVGDRVGVATTVPYFGDKVLPGAELLGMLLGDGSLTLGNVALVEGEDAIVDHVEGLASVMGFFGTRYKDKGTYPGIRFSVAVRDWLKTMGAWGYKSPDRVVPEAVFSARREDVAAFLSGLWNTDGGIVRNRGLRFSSASKQLALDVQHLLARFGVRSSVKQLNYSKGGYTDGTYWVVSVLQYASIVEFSRWIRLVGDRQSSLATYLSSKAGTAPAHHVDLLPSELMDEIHDARKRNCLGWNVLSPSGDPKKTSIVKGRDIRRDKLLRLAEATGAKRLRDLALSPLTFERVVSVERVGVEPVYDLTVIGGQHVFLANGIVCHQSGVVEETADFMLALWSRDTMHGTKADQQTGELSLKIGKSRHGGVGHIEHMMFAIQSLAIVLGSETLEWRRARNEIDYRKLYAEESWEEVQKRHLLDLPLGSSPAVMTKKWEERRIARYQESTPKLQIVR